MKYKIEQEFKEKDPYNPQNTVEGIIYKDNPRYGNLLILKVKLPMGRIMMKR